MTVTTYPRQQHRLPARLLGSADTGRPPPQFEAAKPPTWSQDEEDGPMAPSTISGIAT